MREVRGTDGRPGALGVLPVHLALVTDSFLEDVCAVRRHLHFGTRALWGLRISPHYERTIFGAEATVALFYFTFIKMESSSDKAEPRWHEVPGADLNAPDERGFPPLLLAVSGEDQADCVGVRVDPQYWATQQRWSEKLVKVAQLPSHRPARVEILLARREVKRRSVS